MLAAEIVGWIATAFGAVGSLPQLIRLVKTRSAAGVSLTSWQAWVVVGISWLAHGLSIGQPPQVAVNLAGLCCSIPILVLLSRLLGRRRWLVLAPCLAASAALIAVDQLFGSMVFGIVAIIPAIVATAGQSIELVRAPSVRGVSAPFTVVAVCTQSLWFVWGLLVGDPGSIISAATSAAIVTFNLVWYLARRLGLRPLFAYPNGREPVVAPVPVVAEKVEC